MFFCFFFFFFGFFFLVFCFSSKVFFFDKLNSFECGFDGAGLIQLSFSVQFFIILLLFVIFDLELSVFVSFLVLDYNFLFIFFSLFFFCFFTYYLEVYLKSLFWVV